MINLCPNAPAFWFSLSIVIVSGLLLVFFSIWLLWLSNRSWKYVTSDDKKSEGSKYYPASRKSPLWMVFKQEAGQFFELNLASERKIKKVHFDCGYTSDNPLEANISFFNKYRDTPLIEQIGYPYIKLPLQEDDFQSTTRLILDIPIKAQKIRIEITKPDLQNPWRVNAVYITMKIIFGLEYTIGTHWYDKL